MQGGRQKSFCHNKTRYFVDGFCPEKNRVYEFNGCYWHGHDCNPEYKGPHPTRKGKTYEQLLAATKERTRILKEELKLDVEEIWECEWQIMKKTSAVKTFLKDAFPAHPASFFSKKAPYTSKDIIDAIQNNGLFGFILCDISVPKHVPIPTDRKDLYDFFGKNANLGDYFSEMTPIFKNIDVSLEDVGEHMKTYATDNKLLSQPRRTLVGSYSAKIFLIITPLLLWYLSKGLVVDVVHQFVQYHPKTCFTSFASNVTEMRRLGDTDPKKKLVADTYKLIGNSAYGKCLENLASHTTVEYVDKKGYQKLVREPLYKKSTPLDEEASILEVESLKSKVNWNLPLQIGLFVYQYAKLHMLRFYYDFIDLFISRADFQLIEMDTDSLYMALSQDDLLKVIRPDRLEQFMTEYGKWMQPEACSYHLKEFVESRRGSIPWVAPPCCGKTRIWGMREPGLFKEEWRGDGMVALCSKTYFGWGVNDKYSCKGLNKHINRAKLDRETFLRVLETEEIDGGVNKGFRVLGRDVVRYNQQKKALSYLYIKRRVGTDGISTSPLEI